MEVMKVGRERRFDPLYRETHYLGDDYVIALQEGVRHRTDFTDLSRLRSLERSLLELGYREVRR